MRILLSNIVIRFGIILLLTGCSSHHTYAPVVNGWQQSSATHSYYIVQPEDTIYSIAWSFDRDYRQLAEINHLAPPYRIYFGQKLTMLQKISHPHKVSQNHIKRQLQSEHYKKMDSRLRGNDDLRKNPVCNSSIKHWLWPAQGRLIRRFNLKNDNKGINISSYLNAPVMASASGVVVYSGSGLLNYGKLIIIKHNADFLSAYAHNRNILVKVGQTVTAGQKIATMGRDNSGKIILHFEIRRIGKPVNPLLLLGKK